MRPMNHVTALAVVALVAAGCALGGEDEGGGTLPGARIIALSQYSGMLGDPIDVYVTELPTPDEGRLEICFEGRFDADAGGGCQVDTCYPLRRIDDTTVRWSHFGPYQEPFCGASDGVEGRFQGDVTLHLITPDGESLHQAQPLADIDFEVQPSLVIADFQPLTSSCSGPIKRVIGGIPYMMQVNPNGFDAVHYTYHFNAPSIGESFSVRQVAQGAAGDAIGMNGDFVFPPVPSGLKSYGALVSVLAQDATGRQYANVVAFTVHRPLEIFANGSVKVSEIFAPEPISGCLFGTQSGLTVSQSEVRTDTRSRSLSTNWSDAWSRAQTNTTQSQVTVGSTVANQFQFQFQDQNTLAWTDISGTTAGWDDGAALQAGGSLNFGLSGEGSIGISGTGAKAGFSSGISLNGSYTDSLTNAFRQTDTDQFQNQIVSSNGRTRNRTDGYNESVTSTDSEAITDGESGSEGGADASTVSSSVSDANARSAICFNGQACQWYRQAVRIKHLASVVAYDKCGLADSGWRCRCGRLGMELRHGRSRSVGAPQRLQRWKPS